MPREIVFHAWTDPTEVKRWWGPSGYYTPDAEIDLRPGGRYRFSMVGPHDNTFFLFGTFRQVETPRRLVYTWNWEGTAADGPESLVTVEFHDRGGATEVVVTHAGLATPEARADHARGWTGSLDRLEECL
jgi:uncharacterized protein YndB with AHSA1/START domain